MNTEGQQKRILTHLKRGRKLTRLQAMNNLGIANLTARISELRFNGHKIVDTWTVARNRYGDAVKFKVYSLDKKKAKAA